MICVYLKASVFVCECACACLDIRRELSCTYLRAKRCVCVCDHVYMCGLERDNDLCISDGQTVCVCV